MNTLNDNDDLILEADDVSVKYCKDLKKSLWFGATDIARELSGRAPPPLALRESEMWALRHANIRLRRGECLGVVGANGAGKSTLLKVLNGIFKPDGGTIRVRGRTGALLELGTGFNSTLTGRENVFVNGVILGMTRREVAQRFDEIVAFSEVGDFIDSPVKSYSSGMALRLAFSVAIQMEPDLLLIDEILGVGDVGFRTKCYARMEKRGSRYLRYAIFNAAKYVCHWDPSFAAYLAKKRAEGKHYNVAISHAAKKLVRLIFALEKSGQPYCSAA